MIPNFMEQNSTKLYCKKMKEVGEKTSKKVNIPQAINFAQEVFDMIDIHVFEGASSLGTCAVA